jgi:hypothetical protein
MLDFTPEPIQQLQGRFAACLTACYDLNKLATGQVPSKDRPGDKRENVFDCEDGLRLVVSRDLYEGREVVHFSASVDRAYYKGPMDRSLLNRMVERFYELYGSRPALHFIGLTNEKGIPHWFTLKEKQ